MEEGVSGQPWLAAGLALALAVAAPGATELPIRRRASRAVGMAVVWWE